MHNFQRDGMMQTHVHIGRANYEPNSLAQAGEHGGPRASDQGFVSVARFDEPAAEKRRVRAESFADHFSQARMFFASQTEVEQGHIVAALVFELSKVKLTHVRTRVIGQLRNVDEGLAQRVADGLGVDLPPVVPPAKAPVDLPASDALSMLKKPQPPVAGRCLGVLVTDGADGAVVGALKKAAQEAGASVKIIAQKVGGVALKGGKKLSVDENIGGAPSVLFDAVALVLSADGAAQLMQEKAALDFVSDAYAHCKAIGHTAEAGPLMDKAGVAPDDFVIELASKGERLVAHLSARHWTREKTLKLPV
jgi:catalase